MLSGCASSTVSPTPLQVSGGKSATFVLDSITKNPGHPRPSGTLGIFTSLYLAQRLFLPTESAVRGIEELLHIIRSQEQPLGDETFTLLQTLGDALSVNVVDLLNRSDNRLETLDRYVEALSNATENGKRRSEELKAALETMAAQKKGQTALVREIDRAQKAAVKAKDYGTAGAKEAELTKAQTALSETTLKESQTKSSQKQLTELLTLAEKRLAAISKNREILLSGLQITDPQGLKDLGLVQDTPKTPSGGSFGL
jgi:chromosome segregation ATPase